MSDQMNPASAVVSSEQVNLPYHQLPFGRNECFFGRGSILQRITDALATSVDKPSLRSVALWGTGGIGKSQVALEYAYQQVEHGRQVVIWLPSETESEMSKAIVDAAKQIRPPGYSADASSDMIRYMMWNWLQTTDTSWLLIFDNVEDNDLLKLTWPKTGNGQILVACRSEQLAASAAAHTVEVPPFTLQESGELLLKLAGKDTLDIQEMAAAKEMASMLGGLALGIDITARQILFKNQTVKDFLPLFKQTKPYLSTLHPYKAENAYYSESLDTVWRTAFEGLSENASQLLGILSLVAPDGIPRDLSSTKTSMADNGTWRILEDAAECEHALSELHRASLIRINDKSGTIAVHRLTQEAHFYFLSMTKLRDCFQVTIQLLRAAFPRRTHGRHLYESWHICETLLHHVVAVQIRYDDMVRYGYELQDHNWATLLADAGWYCGETLALEVGEKILRRGAYRCSDKSSLEYAYLCESLATVNHRGGRYPPAYDAFIRAFKIRYDRAQTPAKVLADSYSAVGLARLGLFRYEDAIGSVNKARNIVQKAPAEERTTFNLDRYLRNLARPLVALGRYPEALTALDEAETFQDSVYGKNSIFHGETAYIRGKIELAREDLPTAMHYFSLAYDLQSVGRPTHQSVAAARYQQALVCMRREPHDPLHDNEALLYLDQALQISRFNETKRGDKGESARLKRKIAEIWRRQGRVDDALAHEAAAEAIKLELESTGRYPSAPDAE